MTPGRRSTAAPLAAKGDPDPQAATRPVMVAVAQPLTRGTLVAALRSRGFRVIAGPSDPARVADEVQGQAVGTIIIDHSVDVAELRSRLPDVRLLLLDTSEGHHAQANADRAERLAPYVSLDDLAAVLNGERTAAQAAARRLRPAGTTEASPPPTSELTPRELEVLRELMSGVTAAGIAMRLGISRHTVRTHLQNIFGKLGVHTRLEAVAVALQAGLRPAPGAVADAGNGERQ
ncbi:MAG: response regulator transcription factor [Actinobacteria bacterium]|nr:response regulator transcription factor [Actinomycetota bacterium]